MPTRETRFAICVENRGAEDLDVRKVYRVLPDKDAAATGYVRVIDESGEDYLYPADYFVFVELPLEGEARVDVDTTALAKRRSVVEHGRFSGPALALLAPAAERRS